MPVLSASFLLRSSPRDAEGRAGRMMFCGKRSWGLVRRVVQTEGEVAVMFDITQGFFHVYKAVMRAHLFYLR